MPSEGGEAKSPKDRAAPLRSAPLAGRPRRQDDAHRRRRRIVVAASVVPRRPLVHKDVERE